MNDYNKNSSLQLRAMRDTQADDGYCAHTDFYMRKFYGVDSYCPSNENTRLISRVPRPDNHMVVENYFVSE